MNDDIHIFLIKECLNITKGRPRFQNIDHVDRIDLSHLPEHYVEHYKSLLMENTDIFSLVMTSTLIIAEVTTQGQTQRPKLNNGHK